jgi:NADP-dependent 3-hydroxy acid dehydrogenase YdfG
MKTLNQKVVVITGAGAGIGRALALKAASLGARLALSDLAADGLAETGALITARHGGTPRIDELDVRDRAAMAAYATSVAAQFGVVNVIINNAGVGFFGFFEEMTYEQFEWVMDVNFWGVVRGTKEFLPHLIASGDGHVVNVSSINGLLGVPGQAQYSASKFAVRGFTEALRQEMIVNGHKVALTSVHPGAVKTDIARNAGLAGPRDQGTHAEFFDKHIARTSAEKAAKDIIDGVLKNRARVLVGRDARALDALTRILGPRYQFVVAAALKRVNSRLVHDQTGEA